MADAGNPATHRVALVADTHGYLDPRVAEVTAGCDRVVHAGDIGSDSILEQLDRPSAPVIAVSGNNDSAAHWPADAQQRRLGLDDRARLALPGGELVIIHGHQWPARRRHERLRRTFADAGAIVCGHSHREAIDTEAEPWILNPGAAGRSRAYGGPGCLILSASAEQWQVTSQRFPPLPRRRR